MLTTLILSAALAAAPATSELTAPGPEGALAGTMVDVGKGAPIVLIIPGSGPTDRDGNNSIGRSGTYRLLADGLAAEGVSSVRVDKRGLFGSKAAVANPDAVTIADYAADVHAWTAAIRKSTGASCVWLLGHSEGGLVALAAAQKPAGICGVISVSAPGRPLGETLRAQLSANPANAPLLDPANRILGELEAGRTVAEAEVPAPLAPLFRPSVQAYLIDLLSKDPAKLAAALKVPLLVVQGETDIQTGTEDARRLAGAKAGTRLVLLPGVNHVLKVAPAERVANIAAYRNEALPLAPGVARTIAGFVKN